MAPMPCISVPRKFGPVPPPVIRWTIYGSFAITPSLFGSYYVALNTILKEEELAEAEQMIWQLYEAGRMLDRSRHGYHPVEPSAYPLARQYANG